MKKTAALLFFLFASLVLSAQTTKGSFLIGGKGSLNFHNDDYTNNDFSTRTTTINMAPAAGYFIISNFCAGLSLPLSWSTSKGKEVAVGMGPTSSYKSTSSSFGVGPFIRYYIPLRSFFIVTEGSYSWTFTKLKSPRFDPYAGLVVDSESTVDIHEYKLAAGPAFFLSSYTSIEILFNYSRTNIVDNRKQSEFFVSVGLQVYLPSGLNKE